MMTIQQEIRTGLGRLQLGARPHSGKNYPSFLSPDDIIKILKYLDSKGVIVAEWHEGDFYDAFARLIEE